MSSDHNTIAAVCYVALGRALRRCPLRWRDPLFTALNLAALYAIFFFGTDPRFTALFTVIFAVYVLLVSFHYLVIKAWAAENGIRHWIAFLLPILFLVAIRYLPMVPIAERISHSIAAVLIRHPEFTPTFVFVGVSYLAFRTSHLVVLIRNGTVPMPGYFRFLGFAFFVPTLSVGPISPYTEHLRGFYENPPEIPFGRALTRVLVGVVKYRFLGPILNQFTYSGLLLDDHPHHWVDLPISVISYYLFLYVNFSGFCDIAIGSAGLMGIPVIENFNNPFAARNLREFWNRWHISLSQYMRDIVFSPLSKWLVRILGPARANEAIAISIFVVFLLVGIWHGTGWNYAAFGIAQGIAVVINHYYTIMLKKRLGKEKFIAYNSNRLIHACGVVVTFLYFSATLFFFANDGAAMAKIFAMLRW